MARLDLGVSLDDHPGYPATPGLKAAVARVVGAQEQHRREARERVAARRRKSAMAEAGEEIARLLSTGEIDECVLPKDVVARLRAATKA